MANFYGKLKELIQDCDISYIEPLTYIKHFSQPENIDAPTEKIILFYNRGEPSEKVQRKPVLSPQLEKTEPNLDLTGSPLKDSCQFELLGDSLQEIIEKKNAWNDNEESYHCIKLSEAQSYFNQILFDLQGQSMPKCWAICESTDNTLMISMRKHGKKFCRGILKFNGAHPFEPIDLTELQAKHLSYVVKQYGPSEGMVDSFYRLGRDAVLQVSHTVNSTSQSITTDGKTATKMALHQSVEINNIQSIAHKFWIQLGILNDIKDTIIAYKETKNPRSLIFRGSNSQGDIAEIKQEIYEMLTQPIPIGVNDEDDENSPKLNTNIEKTVENAGMRMSDELTDQLWDVLKGCPSYEILKEVIEYVFTTSAKINVVNMPSSESRLANLIRDVCDHRIAIPRLSGAEPLELLLEIGLEKVNKDYEFIFTESRLCSVEELRADKKLALANGGPNIRKSLKTQFSVNGTGGGPPRKTLMHKLSEQMNLNDSTEMVGFQNSQFNLKNIEGDLARLGRIHLILEHLLMIKFNLNLENVFTTFLDELHKPLVPFDVLKETSQDFQIINVTNAKILSKIGNIPHKQRIFLKSRNRFKIIRNTFCFSTDPIFPPHVFKCVENNDIESEIYFAHQYLEIEDA